MDRVLMLDLSETGQQAIAQRYGVTQPPSGITISGDLDLDSARRASAIWTEMLLSGDRHLSDWLDRAEYWHCHVCHTGYSTGEDLDPRGHHSRPSRVA